MYKSGEPSFSKHCSNNRLTSLLVKYTLEKNNKDAMNITLLNTRVNC
ncbi:hypothetical protein GCM10007425_08050 [Lysinibacillus alkalisoli]|uniref:Uncharacterized protein n=1 Tax=Lysinibacillus alkalisoli TaxID=1911548 RepID=A0A917G099_9BACI|nr:hypothetical protein GCM10007425_08050 [Lysinibacillus alkalisoli]